MMKRILTILVLLGVVVTFSGYVQAAIVPNGDFALYNAAGSRSASVSSNIWVQQIGMDRPLSGGSVTFEDGTTITAGDPNVNIPGWITPIETAAGTTNNADLFSPGIDDTDGTSCMNVFGAWSGQNGGLAMSDAPLAVPAGPVTISAMLQGDPLPYLFQLLVDGVALVPDSATDPVTTDWREVTRTYNTVPAGDVRILIGTPKPGEGDPPLTGSRLKIDNVSIIPEPATMGLLTLGGLALLRRRRRA